MEVRLAVREFAADAVSAAKIQTCPAVMSAAAVKLSNRIVCT
jgi:hypothetical protein